MKWSERLAAGAVPVAAAAAMLGVFTPAIGLPLLAVSILAAWRWVPRFWRMAGAGLAGGVVAGVLVLGPAMRVAMRMVAVMDPNQTPEFTLGGTMFIIVGIGAIMGGVGAGSFYLLRHAAGIRSAVLAGTALGVWFTSQLVFFSGDISDEIFELGLGGWVNIPLFGLISVAYGIAAFAFADWLLSKTSKTRRSEREKVAA